MISTNGKDTKWFFSYEEANEFKSTSKGYTHRYIKGLGSLTESEYDRVINNPVLDTITVDDANYFQIMFGNDVSLRKEIMTA
jgi:DNA topoisomerase-2